MDNFYQPPESKMKLYFALLLVAFVSFVGGWQLNANGYLGETEVGKEYVVIEGEEGTEIVSDVDLALFMKVWEELQKKYVDVDKLDEETMVYGAIAGFVEAIDDQYTVFLPPVETEEFMINLDGQLEGIGAELTVENGALVVISPLRESPAEKAGLLPKDIIAEIEGLPATDMGLMEAIGMIRGEKGTTVNLTIWREGVEPFVVSIVRDSIKVDSVSSDLLENDIMYLVVNQFNDSTDEKFSEAISKMILDEPEGLIIDLRFNGGGYLDIAIEMLSYLVPTDEVAVIIRERNKDDEINYTVDNPKLLNVPVVVLVNEASASASEIVAGAIQDLDRGIVMGQTTYGKGSVQEVEYFNDGSSLRLTIAKWLTPDERDINKVGVTPDIIVDFTDEDIENEFDAQKEAAIKYLEEL
jgi:carboxyl-terminal processing protease